MASDLARGGRRWAGAVTVAAASRSSCGAVARGGTSRTLLPHRVRAATADQTLYIEAGVLTMRALTIWQPWATLIVLGNKPVENRDWPVPAAVMGERVAIHGGRTWDDEGARALETFRKRLALPEDLPLHPGPQYPLGAIVGTARVVASVVEHPSPWFHGRFGHVMQQPLVFATPIFCKGDRGYWVLSPELEEQVNALERRIRQRSTDS